MSKNGLMIEESVVHPRIDEKKIILNSTTNSQALPQKTDSHYQQFIEQLDLIDKSKVIFLFHLISQCENDLIEKY
jgi:hypothetical protein